MKISVVIIGTKVYYDFAVNLISSINKYFMLGHDVNIYLFTDEETFLNNCKLYGIIDDKVVFRNKANLSEILGLELYEKV